MGLDPASFRAVKNLFETSMVQASPPPWALRMWSEYNTFSPNSRSNNMQICWKLTRAWLKISVSRPQIVSSCRALWYVTLMRHWISEVSVPIFASLMHFQVIGGSFFNARHPCSLKTHSSTASPSGVEGKAKRQEVVGSSNSTMRYLLSSDSPWFVVNSCVQLEWSPTHLLQNMWESSLFKVEVFCRKLFQGSCYQRLN